MNWWLLSTRRGFLPDVPVGNTVPQEPQKIYVIQNELGPVKIGIAADPQHRLRELQVGSPFELSIKKTETPHDAKEVERFLHNRFRKYHLRGEWFAIPEDQRDFEIPTHINSAGEPNTPVKISANRDFEAEWAEMLERFALAMRGTKHVPPDIEGIRRQWQKFGGVTADEEDDTMATKPADQTELAEDTPRELVRCTQCGHHYDRSESGCPTCGGGDQMEHSHRY